MKCSACPESFKNAFNLLKHAQLIHKLEIFQLDEDIDVTNSISNNNKNEIYIDVISSGSSESNDSFNYSNQTFVEHGITRNTTEQGGNGNTKDENSMTSTASSSSYTSSLSQTDSKCKRDQETMLLNKQRSFYCDVCQVSFNQKIHLKKHSAKHTGNKPFKCGECDYATVEKSHLKVHVRVHTGEKPFKCGHCKYSTAQSSTLKVIFNEK